MKRLDHVLKILHNGNYIVFKCQFFKDLPVCTKNNNSNTPTPCAIPYKVGRRACTCKINMI